MKKLLSILCFSLLILNVFSGLVLAGNIKTELSKDVEITFWHAMSGGHEEALKNITEKFNAQDNRITVKLVNQGYYNDLSQKIMAAGKARTLPTMAQTYPDWVTEYLNYNLAADLTPYIKDPDIGWTRQELNDIASVFLDSVTWDGKYYSLPFNKSTYVLFYNTKMFEDNNLDLPETWEELQYAAKVLTVDKDGDGKNDVIGLGFENSYEFIFEMFVYQAGGQLIDEDMLEAKFNSTAGREALNYWKGLIDDGVARFAGEDGYMSGPFGRGDVAMYIGSSAGIPYVADAAKGNIEFSTAALPGGKKAAVPIMGTNVTVFQTASADEKLAAWEYIKYLINTENTAYWAKMTGYMPVRHSAGSNKDYLLYKINNPIFAVAEKQIDNGYFSARCKGSNAAMNSLSLEIEAIILGKKTINKGLEDAQRAVERELERAN